MDATGRHYLAKALAVLVHRHRATLAPEEIRTLTDAARELEGQPGTVVFPPEATDNRPRGAGWGR